MKDRKRVWQDSVDNLDNYAKRTFIPSVHDKEVICGYTFHPGLFRFWASKDFGQLLEIYGFDGVQARARGNGEAWKIDHSLIEKIGNATSPILSEEVKSGDRSWLFSLMHSLFPIAFAEIVQKQNSTYEQRWEFLQELVKEKEQEGKIPSHVYTVNFSWYKVMAMAQREISRIQYRSHDELASEECMSFYNMNVVKALLDAVAKNAELNDVLREKFNDVLTVKGDDTEPEYYVEVAQRFRCLVKDATFKLVCRSLDMRGVLRPDEFVYAFVGTGLFAYTRSLIAFEGKTFDGLTSEESFNRMREEMLGQPLSQMYTVYSKLK